MENSDDPENLFLKIRRRWNKRTEWMVVVAVFAISVPVFFFFATEKAELHNSGMSPHIDRKGENYHIVFDYDQHPYLNAGRQFRESNYQWTMPRHRMPGYSYILSTLFDQETAYPKTRANPRKVSDGFFERGKLLNILLSIGVLIGVFAFLRLWLPAIESLIVTWGFGWCLAIFKAPYVQPENLFYLTFAISFLLVWNQLRKPTWTGGILAGLALAATYFLKSAVTPLIALFIACFALKVLAALFVEWRQVRAGDRDAISWGVFATYIARGVVVPVTFLALMTPYFLNTWKIHGEPFWDVHSKYYMWMEDRTDKYKWRDLGIADPDFESPEGEEAPSFGKFWREHSLRDFFYRFRDGFNDLRARVNKDYHGAYVMAKKVCLIAALAICVVCWRRLLPLLRERWPEALLVFGFFIGYSLLYGWYEKIGVGPRLMLGLYLPFLITSMLVIQRFGDQTVRIPKTPIRFNPRYLANAVIAAMILVNAVLVLSRDLWAIEGGR